MNKSMSEQSFPGTIIENKAFFFFLNKHKKIYKSRAQKPYFMIFFGAV